MSVEGRPAWLEPATGPERLAKVVILTLILIAVVYPFLNVLSTSLATEQELVESGGLVLVPRSPSLDAYRTVFESGVIPRAIVVSLCVTAVGTAVSLLVTIGMAYGLSRPVVGQRPLLMMALFTLLFTPGIIPSYLVVKELGLLDSYASLILPVMINAFNLVVLRQFFMSIPQELIDSAKIDGAGDLRVLVSIVLPLSKAVLAVVTLFYAVAYWNAFFTAMLYLSDSSRWPLQLVVRLFVLQGAHVPGATRLGTAPEQAIQMAVVVVSVLPILLVYPFLQKYFTRGVLTGAIKG